MKKQKGYIDIPDWFFWLAPIGAVLVVVEFARLLWWLYGNIEVTLK